MSSTAPSPKSSKLSDEDCDLSSQQTENEPISNPVDTLVIDTRSPLERLPKEIMWSILEYVPEIVFDLRSASRTLQNQVDGFARLLYTIPLVEDLSFYGNEKGGVCGKRRRDFSPRILVSMYIPILKANLFELRLKLRNPPDNFVKRIIRNVNCGDMGDCNAYHLEFDTEFVIGADKHVWEYLVDCMGKKIGKAVLFECRKGAEFEKGCGLLESFKFDKLTVTIGNLSDYDAKNLLDAIKSHHVDKLSLSVCKVSASNKVKLLLELSSLVHSLHVKQMDTPPYRRTFFFGMDNADWAPAIIDMFTRKLDKLHIENRHNQNFLWSTSADTVVQNLPQINKHLWFVSSCCTKKASKYSFNNFVIKSYRRGVEHRKLSIKHASRVNEKF